MLQGADWIFLTRAQPTREPAATRLRARAEATTIIAVVALTSPPLPPSSSTSTSTSNVNVASNCDRRCKVQIVVPFARLSKQLARGSLPPRNLSHSRSRVSLFVWPPQFGGKSTRRPAPTHCPSNHRIVRKAQRIMSISCLHADKHKLRCMLCRNVYCI